MISTYDTPLPLATDMPMICAEHRDMIFEHGGCEGAGMFCEVCLLYIDFSDDRYAQGRE